MRWLPLVLLACQANPTDIESLMGLPESGPMGPPLPLQLTIPTLYKGVPFTVSVTGGPPGARLSIVEGGPDTNPLFCPTRTAPECLGVHEPILFIGRSTVGHDGIGTIDSLAGADVTQTQGTFQAVAYTTGQLYLSNVVTASIVDTCVAPVATTPLDGDGVAPADADLTVTYADDVAPYQSYTLTGPSGDVPLVVEISDDETVATLDAPPLDGQSTYTLSATDPCGDTRPISTFTTGDPGSVGGENLPGRGYTFVSDELVIVDPPAFQSLVPLVDVFANAVVLFVASYDDSTEELVAGAGKLINHGGVLVQDPCRPTLAAPAGDFSADPTITWDLPTFGAVEQATLTTSFTHEGDDVIDGSGSGYVFAIDIGSALSVTEQDVCDLAVALGAPGCVTCPISTNYQCIYVEVEGLRAQRVGGTFAEITEAEALQDCGSLSEWL